MSATRTLVARPGAHAHLEASGRSRAAKLNCASSNQTLCTAPDKWLHFVATWPPGQAGQTNGTAMQAEVSNSLGERRLSSSDAAQHSLAIRTIGRAGSMPAGRQRACSFVLAKTVELARWLFIQCTHEAAGLTQGHKRPRVSPSSGPSGGGGGGGGSMRFEARERRRQLEPSCRRAYDSAAGSSRASYAWGENLRILCKNSRPRPH